MIKIKKQYILYFSILFLLCTMILLPKICITGAKEGLLLWFNVIIPSLFPFIIISNLIIELNIVKYITKFLNSIMEKIFHLPGIAGYAYIIGMLSGYPMGAKITVDLLEKKHLTPTQAQYLLTFCNNASPMFVLGFVSIEMLEIGNAGLYLLVILYLSSFITAIIFRFIYQPSIKSIKTIKKYTQAKQKIQFSYVFDQCIMNAVELIVKVGAYIMFFSIILNLLSIIPFNYPIFKNFLLGIVEISNGVNLISNYNCYLELKIILINTIIAFGGLSITAQTYNIIQNSSLKISHYMFAKLLNAILTFIITLLFLIFYSGSWH